MTKRLWVAIICFLLVVGLVIYSTVYLNTSTKELEAPVQGMISSLQEEDIKTAEEYFATFTELYEQRRPVLAIFLHDLKINEINLSVNRLKGLFGEEYAAEALPEAESLLDNIYAIQEDYFPALEKIF